MGLGGVAAAGADRRRVVGWGELPGDEADGRLLRWLAAPAMTLAGSLARPGFSLVRARAFWARARPFERRLASLAAADVCATGSGGGGGGGGGGCEIGRAHV